MHVSSQPSSTRTVSANRGPDKMRVLVVEDESDIAGLVKHTLERSGDAVVELAASGDQALKVSSEQQLDLIILDLNLPVLGGLEVCRLLRTRPATAKTPIIMLTARASESDRVVGLDAGADDYITKPFSPRELAARVRALLFDEGYRVMLTRAVSYASKSEHGRVVPTWNYAAVHAYGVPKVIDPRDAQKRAARAHSKDLRKERRGERRKRETWWV